MDTVVEGVIAEARQELARGKNTAAARLLTDAAYRTRDPEAAGEIIRLAEDGKAQAGFFGKGRWKEIIRVAGARTSADGSSENGAGSTEPTA